MSFRKSSGPLAAGAFLLAATSAAQPSGGPYGPIHQSYPVPKAAHVYYVAPDGKAEAAGTTLAEPTTIESAIAKVVTGDAIVMRGGVYRTGALQLNQGITIQPYLEEKPILKGTLVATQWEALRNNLWRTRWKTLFPARPLAWWNRAREGMRTPLHRFNNDMVFVDGEMLKSAGWEGELDGSSYYVDYDNGWVYIGRDPKDRLVEITAFDGALIRVSGPAHGKESDKKGPVIRGITFTQYPFRALEVQGKTGAVQPNVEPTDEPVGLQDPSTFGKEVTGTLLENVTITFCSRVAGYFRGDGLVIRNSLVSDTSTEGIYVIGSSDVLLEKNIVKRNNIEQLTGYYPAAVKIFNQTRRVICRDNLVIDNPYSNGIWYDVGNIDGVFVNNWIENAIDGFFFEISKGVIAAGNVFVRCNKGVRILNAAGARLYNNTFIDTPLSIERNERVATGDTFAWHTSTGPDVDKRDGHVVVNNLFVAGDTYKKPLLRTEQARTQCAKLKDPQVKEMDGNVYVRSSAGGPLPLFTWSPSATESCLQDYDSLDAFRKALPAFEAKSRYIDAPPSSVLKGPDLQHYGLQRPLPGGPATSLVPTEVLKLLGWSAAHARTVGAYPVRP
jgi:hypothetical protein